MNQLILLAIANTNRTHNEQQQSCPSDSSGSDFHRSSELSVSSAPAIRLENLGAPLQTT